MKKIYSPLFALLAIVFWACGDKNEPSAPITPDQSGVEVSIASTAIDTQAATLEFGNGAKMNIFPKTYNRIDAPNIVDGVVATLSGNNWTMEPKVYINEQQKNAFVYAVSPYDPSYTNGAEIPVDVNRQVDLMYSGSYQPASLTSPTVKLTMKHALSLLSFNIVPVNFAGSAQLTEITLSGQAFYAKGTMDASTGEIKLTETGKVVANYNKAVAAGGWQSDIPGVWSLPFNTKAGVVNVSATIGGKTYELELPEVEVKQGWQYIFRLTLTNNGLEFDPSKTETISLNVTSDSLPEFAGFGSVSLISSGGWVMSPAIHGDGVFGTLISPKGSATYDGALKIEGLNAGDKVSVESWNSDGFSLETLDGVKTIDISQYE